MSLTDIATTVQLSTEDNYENNDEDDEPVLPQVSSKAATKALAQASTFVMQQEGSTTSSKY